MALDTNTLTSLVPKILARGLMVLRKKCIMPRLVNSDYSSDAARKGSTIDVPVPVEVTTVDVTPTEVHTEQAVGITAGIVQVPLNNWKQNYPIHLTDKEMGEIDVNESFLPMQLQEAIKALAGDVNADILQEYMGVYGYVGTAATTPFNSTVGVSSATGVRRILNKQLCPLTDRRGVLDFDAEANALDLSAFSDAEKTMSETVKMEGEIGRKFGIDWVADDDVPLHTAGTATGTTMRIAVAAGLSALDITGTHNHTYKVGDIITITNSPDDDDQTYAIGAGTDGADGYVASTKTWTVPVGTNIAALAITPALKFIADSGATLTTKATHRVNLVFHRDAFAFATRALDDANAMARALGGSQVLSMQDPQTGLVLRLEVSRRHKLTCWEFDILWGAKLVRPELACRLAG